MIEFKKITENELELLMNWRNSEAINSMMCNTVHLTMEGQLKWFEKIKNSTTEIRWIIWNDGVPIGSLYLQDIDYKNKRCDPGWFLAEKANLTLAEIIAIQRNAYDFVFDTLKFNRIWGYVLDINKEVARLVSLCGAKIEGELIEHVIKDGKAHNVFVIGLTKKQWTELKEQKNISYPKYSFET